MWNIMPITYESEIAHPILATMQPVSWVATSYIGLSRCLTSPKLS
jgi:hypothetical protein